MKAFYFKELRQYFTTSIGYVFLSILLLIGGVIFTTGNLLSQSSDLRMFFSSFFTTLIFVLPVVTMRQFSEEKKMKTIQLLFTLPLKPVSIVLGKFFATLTVVSLGLLLTLIYPLILSTFGTVEMMVVVGNYLGLFLLVSSVLSIGLYISSITENQIVSAVITYAIVLGLWLIDTISPFVLDSSISVAINRFSLRQNYLEFTYGIFNPGSILFYGSVTALFLTLTVLSLERRP